MSWNPFNVLEEFGIISEVCSMSSPIWSTWTRTFTWVVNTKTWMRGAIPSTIPMPGLQGISFRMTSAQDIFALQWARNQKWVTTGPWLITTGHLAKMWRWATPASGTKFPPLDQTSKIFGVSQIYAFSSQKCRLAWWCWVKAPDLIMGEDLSQKLRQ